MYSQEVAIDPQPARLSASRKGHAVCGQMGLHFVAQHEESQEVDGGNVMPLVTRVRGCRSTVQQAPSPGVQGNSPNRKETVRHYKTPRISQMRTVQPNLMKVQ